ncbi:MFS general substrate transporter [Aaosphaeria arxii CBS 175.79]|uniref:MFS general substrate transporter n=1 Tax=Aaosphaeria arxii CBS 175.79 TaxID=1450172 RepID=A0A6A5Y7S8_9PLEO|nr:MFS general substrate transporter [Aaosphaeria arxii CBS 175.79]KAF2021283.1 MFS general substrate transporter [Aaosphaeria arxii CBS 175.79]
MALTQGPKLSSEATTTGIARQEVLERYEELLIEQKSSPDHVFISGSSFRELDPNLVVLDEKAREHPRDWLVPKKIRATAMVGAYCFLSPFASTIFAPSVHLVMADLNITDSTLGALAVSIFLFGFAIGPLVLAPMSELYGRRLIINCGNLVFVAFSIGAGFVQTPAQLFTSRIFAGLGGSAALSIVGGTVADMWDLKARPKASGLVMLGPVLGPILGPVCGGWMSEAASWRWTLWVPAIASGILSVAGYFFLPETYAPRVLQHKLQKMKTLHPDKQFYTVLDLTQSPSGLRFLFSQFVRPLVYLAVDPALALASIFYAVLFGVVYLVIVTLADVFGHGYGHSVGFVGTDFLSAGVGMIIGTFGTIRVMEMIFKKDTTTGQMKYKPESRLLSCIVGGILSVGGLFMYGFSAMRTHYIVPLIGIAIFACGTMNIMLAIQIYAVDGFKYPASAFAAISVLRCLFAGFFPLFGPKLFVRLGVDWGVGLLAFLVLGLGTPMITLLYIFGPRLRKIGVQHMSRFEGDSG